MAEVASAFVTLVPSAKGFGKGISSQLDGDLDRAGKSGGKRLGGGLSSSFLPATKGLAVAAAGIFAAAKIGGFLKGAIAEARESQKVGALTAQVIKSTGGAAKVTAGQVGDLATAISNKTGIDDEAIQSASNLLLTFTNVRNEVGKGNDIFNQATQAATDMGAALGGDPKTSAIQLGKALNDPVKGIAALTRVGVSFTAQQKDQVKAMVKSGDTLGAQKLILGELNKEFGGAAAASATAGEKLSVAFGNFKEQIGTALLPVIDKVAGFLTNKIVPALAGAIPKVTNFAKGIAGVFSILAKGDFKGAAATFGLSEDSGVVDFLFTLRENIVQVGAVLTGTVIPAVKGFFASFQSGGGPGKIAALFQTLVSFFTGQVLPAVMGIVTAFRGYLTVVIPIVQAFVTGMIARIGPLMPQIRTIFATIGTIIVQAMALVKAVIERVTAIIGAIWSRWGTQIMNVVGFVFKTIVAVVGGALKVVSAIIKTVTAIIKGDWSGAWDGIKKIVSSAWSLIKAIVSAGFTVLKTVFGAAKGALKALASRIWDDVKSTFSTGIDKAVTLVKSLPGKITGALGNLGGLLRDAGAKLIQGLADGIIGRIRSVTDAAGKVASAIKGFFPGSPVKEGPLTSWNNGGAGKRLGGLLADGLDASRAQVRSSAAGLAGTVVGPEVGSGSTAGVGGSQAGLVQALTTALERANLNASISAGSVDEALAGGYRG